MRYSLNLPNGGACADARTLAELAHDAEEAGWDGVFLEDLSRLCPVGVPGSSRGKRSPWITCLTGVWFWALAWVTHLRPASPTLGK